jgi:hypothetical protein
VGVPISGAVLDDIVEAVVAAILDLGDVDLKSLLGNRIRCLSWSSAIEVDENACNQSG